VPHSPARTLGPSAVGSTATSGELRENGGRNSARSTLRSRALASVGYWAEHAALARVSPGGAETLQAGCNELRVALHLLRRPFDKFWLHLDNANGSHEHKDYAVERPGDGRPVVITADAPVLELGPVFGWPQ